MKNMIMAIAAAGVLTIGGLAYGFSSSNSACPLEGTPECPKINCPLAGTPDCPYDKTIEVLPACCRE
ncbi:hypothetical protein OOZ15_08000 [Galbibacter sp. EGI 63066]|uniref:hypothetical protein n=1 Tax=Galbibacter sp. EGI 63066 TaxID=2993559 RepID=UPI0022492118|nr:hypothetical protein [Galbibacter sp. EGI 63066]MCX2679874.1 hypothetical protein [Galbibacter sp. EGI 63066]